MNTNGFSKLAWRGATIVELLVVMAILGAILALLVPAIAIVRERSRVLTCQNHLKQLALAAILHEQTKRHFPTGGWGGGWVGDGERGFDRRQPGGWIYNVLPYLERGELHALDQGKTGVDKSAAVAQRLRTTFDLLHCPSRRPARLYPVTLEFAKQPRGSLRVDAVARSDYAMNAGDQCYCEVFGTFFGPASLGEGDAPSFRWPIYSPATGVSYLRSMVRAGDLADGASHVYLLGEKSLPVPRYATGDAHGDDWSAYTGFQDDIYRTTCVPKFAPVQDNMERGSYVMECAFGSAHDGAWNAAFCDGAVQLINYSIDEELHRARGNRDDAAPH